MRRLHQAIGSGRAPGGVAALVALAGLVFAAGQAGAAPRLTARAALVMDAASGETIWARNPDDPLPPASTTKILTAILALESGRLDERFAVSEFAAETAPSKINLRPGQRMQLPTWSMPCCSTPPTTRPKWWPRASLDHRRRSRRA